MDLGRPLHLVFFGSGEFGLPTLHRLVEDSARFQVRSVVSQPDRPAGRRRHLTPTPVAEWAARQGLKVLKPEDVNDPEVVARIRGAGADAYVVIAFGQRIGRPLLEGVFAINLHGSMLPAYRGAAPIQRAMMDGATETGVSVIALADRMDAGEVYRAVATPIRTDETAGELHDRLAQLGPEAVVRVLEEFRMGALRPHAQDDRLVSLARKLTKAEGTVDFALPADRVRARVHGLTPWPGCAVQLDGQIVKLARVRDLPQRTYGAAPGEVLPDLSVACGQGAIEIVQIQPQGGRPMDLASFRNGHEYKLGMRLSPAPP